VNDIYFEPYLKQNFEIYNSLLGILLAITCNSKMHSLIKVNYNKFLDNERTVEKRNKEHILNK
jgi:hypothetical protein